MKLQIITNLFPLPWEPNRAAFNRQQFLELTRIYDTRVLVLISWLERLKQGRTQFPDQLQGLSLDYSSYLYLPRLCRFSYAATLLPTLLLKLAKIKRFRPDCLFLSWAYPDGVAGVVLARLLKTPAILKVHGSDVYSHCEDKLRRTQIVWAMRKSAAVICVSQALADEVAGLGVPRNKLHVIYNGIDHNLFKPAPIEETRLQLGVPESRKALLYIGNLKPAKGCEDLLVAFGELVRSNEEVDLYYIGSGPSASRMRSMIEVEGLGERVKLLGTLPHSELVQWINASDAVVLPSHSEGVPNVLLEAMACGKPVVATRVGGIPEIVQKECGILVSPQDTRELVAALELCLATWWDSSVIAESMRTFSWENNLARLDSVITTAVKGQP